jgi:lipopolysaccharide export LptBFGC system permease protein LptF
MSTAASAAAVRPRQQGGFTRFWRALKQLFHELAGAIFAVFAFAWLNAAFRAWTRDVAHWLIAMALLVAALFAFFAVTSFRRARKL